MSTVLSKTKVAGQISLCVGLLALALSGCSGNGLATAGGASLPPTETTGSTGSVPAGETDGDDAETISTGCPATAETMPAEAETSTIGDVDGDGERDTQWYSEATAPFTYGITTASGATHSITDNLAGPGRHSGWTAPLHNGVVVTVLDDSRRADLYAFVDCAFVKPIGVDGQQYAFDMQNLRGNGTGVGCMEVENGLELNGLQVSKNKDGTFSQLATGISVSADGRSAMNGYTAVFEDIPEGDPQLDHAHTSSCADLPIVSTSGR